jgi:hypothetical protein
MKFYAGQYKGKIVPVFNQAPLYEDAWWSGGISPSVINCGTEQRLVANFTPLTPHRLCHRYLLDKEAGIA